MKCFHLLIFSETLGHRGRNENERAYILENACKREKGERIVISIPRDIGDDNLCVCDYWEEGMPVHTFNARV